MTRTNFKVEFSLDVLVNSDEQSDVIENNTVLLEILRGKISALRHFQNENGTFDSISVVSIN